MAISQSTLNKEQIELILSSKGLTGNILETTTAELANTTATNAVAVAEGTATTATIALGNAFKGLGAKIKAFVAANQYQFLIIDNQQILLYTPLALNT
jgi:hypothetical protein